MPSRITRNGSGAARWQGGEGCARGGSRPGAARPLRASAWLRAVMLSPQRHTIPGMVFSSPFV